MGAKSAVASYFKGTWAPKKREVKYEESEIPIVFHDYLNFDGYVPNKLQLFLAQFWDTFDKPPVYRRYINKLDLFLMMYFFLSFFIKTLDNTNISNAYVSGMKEDLALNGQQRNLFTTFWNIGYIVGCVPSQFLVNYMRPSVWLPLCELGWSVFVMLIATAQSAKSIYAYRFLIGLCETTTYPAIAMIIGSWYKPSELAKRMSVYDLASAFGSIISGFIQAGVYTSLNGKAGIAGWRWLFIIDGIITIPIAALGFYAIPDFPDNTRVPWLTDIEKDFSVVRMAELGQKSTRRLSIRRFLGYFKSWRIYGFNWMYVIFNIAGTYGYFNLWLKSLGIYTVQQINLIPTAGYGMAIVICYLTANISDRMGKRWPMLLLSIFFNFFGNLMLAIWSIPFGLKYFSFFCAELGYPVWALVLTWGSEAFQDDAELRGLLSAVGNTVSNSISAWLPLLAFPTQDAPHYKWGYGFMAGLNVLSVFGVVFFIVMEKRELKMKGRVLNKFGLAVDAEGLKDFAAPITTGYGEVEHDTEKGIGHEGDTPSITDEKQKLGSVAVVVREID